MSISSWFPWMFARRHKGRTRPSHSPALLHRARLVVEQLEDRTVPTTFTAANVDELIADINLANQTAEADTIELAAGTTFTLTQVNNTTNGANGLPVIEAAGGPLTIHGNTIGGNGATIERSTVFGTPFFRLFEVASGASLTLANMTLQGGWTRTGGGGGIFNQGALDLKGVTVRGNLSGYGSLAGSGGGIYSSGSLTLQAGTIISGNSASGYNSPEYCDQYGCVYVGDGGPAFGGGVYVAGGTATLSNVTLSSNSASGGVGISGGSGYGGGLYVAAGTVTLTSATLSSNSAVGRSSVYGGDFGGSGVGGGLYVAAGTVTLTSDTVSSNSAVGGFGYIINGVGIGGGLYVAGGVVTLTNDTVSSNSAGGPGAEGAGLAVMGGTVTLRSVTVTGNIAKGGSPSGYAVGGGVYVAGGTVTLTDSTLSSNSAVGGRGNYFGGSAYGGGLYAAGGTVTLRNVTVTGNSAQGGTGEKGKYKKQRGPAGGGGLYVSDFATVYLDAFTVAHTTDNKPDNIYGSYTLI